MGEVFRTTEARRMLSIRLTALAARAGVSLDALLSMFAVDVGRLLSLHLES